MYVPPRYRVTDDAAIDAFLRANAFATLVTAGSGGLMATHIPVELSRAAGGARLLQGHLSRGNQQWKDLGNGAEAMLVFLGPHTYISPTWYDHPNVPTWNYQAVHVYGTVRTLHERGDLLHSVRGLSERYEPAEQPPPRFDVDAMPDKVREAELKGIVAFELLVTRVEAAFKLSQNRNDTDHARIIEELERRGDADSRRVAQAMKAHR
jgi:transcriptional regulator